MNQILVFIVRVTITITHIVLFSLMLYLLLLEHRVRRFIYINQFVTRIGVTNKNLNRNEVDNPRYSGFEAIKI